MDFLVRIARQAGLAALFVIAAVAGTLSGVLFAYTGDLPRIYALDDYAPSTITRVYAANNQVIGEFAVQRRVVIGYDDIAPALRQAIIAAEDADFDRHFGLSVSRIIVTFVKDLIYWRKAGASTLTQQLARKLFLTDEKTWERKIKEAILAIQIEKRYTKREILTLYCNQIYWGHGAYGAEAASRLYFGKRARQLNLEEAALLAGIIQTPERQSPYIDRDRARRRRNYALQRMADEGYITQAQADAATATSIVLGGEPTSQPSVAPYFLEEVRKYVEGKYGAKQLYEAGLSIHTSLDVRLQQVANRAVREGTERLDRRRPPLVEGALLAIDNRTGQIRAMVGGYDFARSQFNRSTQASRQLGSAFKPFVYTAAIDRGYTPVSILVDSPVAYPAGPGQEVYSPTNYDGTYEGAVTLRHALEKSRNVPAVRLMEQLGPAEVIAYARRLGIESPLPPYLSVALGAAEATLLETTSAYTVFPNQGVRMRPYYVMKITDREGNVLEENRPDTRDAIRADTAFVMTSLLRGVVQRGTAARAASLGWPFGGKTGTTDDYTDAWFIGFDPDITVGVWVGHDEKKSLGRGRDGAHAALPIWIDFMRAHIGTRKNPPQFPQPGNIIFLSVDRHSGALTDSSIPGAITETFIAGTQPGGAFPP